MIIFSSYGTNCLGILAFVLAQKVSFAFCPPVAVTVRQVILTGVRASNEDHEGAIEPNFCMQQIPAATTSWGTDLNHIVDCTKDGAGCHVEEMMAMIDGTLTA